MELASSLRKLGTTGPGDVSPGRLPLSRVLGDRVAALLLARHEANGVEFHLGATPVRRHGGARRPAGRALGRDGLVRRLRRVRSRRRPRASTASRAPASPGPTASRSTPRCAPGTPTSSRPATWPWRPTSRGSRCGSSTGSSRSARGSTPRARCSVRPHRTAKRTSSGPGRPACRSSTSATARTLGRDRLSRRRRGREVPRRLLPGRYPEGRRDDRAEDRAGRGGAPDAAPPPPLASASSRTRDSTWWPRRRAAAPRPAEQGAST